MKLGFIPISRSSELLLSTSMKLLDTHLMIASERDLESVNIYNGNITCFDIQGRPACIKTALAKGSANPFYSPPSSDRTASSIFLIE